MTSSWSSPNPVLFGSGCASLVGTKLSEFGCTKVLIVYDKGIKASGTADKIISYIEKAGISVVQFGEAVSDAPDYSINSAGELARKEKVDGIVAVGGGSSLDTGKGARILVSNPPPINSYYSRPSEPGRSDLTNLIPLILLPTTSGTGSEVTPGGASADTGTGAKENFICPVSLGLIDPELTISLPPVVTAMTAFDALSHAVEAMTSNEPNPFSDILASKAISNIGRFLPRAVADGSDLEAREGLMLSATLASMSILGPYCNIPHDIGMSIGQEFHIPHGLACSSTLAEVMNFIAPCNPSKVALVARCLGSEIADAASPEEIGQATRAVILKLMDDAKMPALRTLVPSREALLNTSPRIMKEQNFHFSTRPVTECDVRSILAASYDAR